MYLNALLVAQQASPDGGGGDTAILAAFITAAAVVLAALITILGQRNSARLDAIEKKQDQLGSAIERVERRMEDALARLTDRIDRLYSNPPRFTPTVPNAAEGSAGEEAIAELERAVRRTL